MSNPIALLASLSADMSPILVAVSSIGLLLILILVFKIQAFVSLLIVSLFVGLFSGMPLETITSENGDVLQSGIIDSMKKGMGGLLGGIAAVIGLGAIFGKILEHSGGTEALARKLLAVFGQEKATWAMMLTGFIVSIPVFLDTALVILIPIVYALTRESGKPLLYFGMPLLAGLAVTHSFIPPTPGPILVTGELGAELGLVILYGAIVGLPTAIIAGPIWGAWISKRITIGVPEMMDTEGETLKNLESQKLPSFYLVSVLIGLPLILMIIGSTLSVMANNGTIPDSGLVAVLSFIGKPIIALLIATMLTFYVLGIRQGTDKDELLDICTKSLGPAGIIILITGAGGAFKQVLKDSGVGDTLAALLQDSNMSYMVLAYLLTGLVRVAQGSATVAMVTGVSFMKPILDTMDPLSEPHKALLVLAIAAGATLLGHVNDSGFWLVKNYFGMTEKQTLQSFTTQLTIISVVGFSLTLLLSVFV